MNLFSTRNLVGAGIAGLLSVGAVGLANAQTPDDTTDDTSTTVVEESVTDESVIDDSVVDDGTTDEPVTDDRPARRGPGGEDCNDGEGASADTEIDDTSVVLGA